jgi:hypothetical protein
MNLNAITFGSLFTLLAVACGGTTTTTTDEPDTSGGSDKAPSAQSPSGGGGGGGAAAPSGSDAKKGGDPAPAPSSGGSTPPDPGSSPPPPAGDPGGTPGQDGSPGRISVNEHCCYGGKYYKCPNSAACFGGFDIDACLAACSGPMDPCWDACFNQLDSAGPPKGCQSGVAEPKGVDCANGQINI